MKRVLIVVAIILPLVTLISFRKKDNIFMTKIENSFMENVTIRHVDSATMDWTAVIKMAVIETAGNKAEITGIRFTFPQQNLTVSADTGLYNMKNDDLLLSGTVRAGNGDMDITTGPVTWHATKRELVSDSAVRIEGKSYTLSGTGLQVDENGTIILNNDVKATIYQ
jgi:LPS export ABC transporter protein LptC